MNWNTFPRNGEKQSHSLHSGWGGFNKGFVTIHWLYKSPAYSRDWLKFNRNWIKRRKKEKRTEKGKTTKPYKKRRVLDFKLTGLELPPRRAPAPGLLHRLSFSSPSTSPETIGSVRSDLDAFSESSFTHYNSRMDPGSGWIHPWACDCLLLLSFIS